MPLADLGAGATGVGETSRDPSWEPWTSRDIGLISAIAVLATSWRAWLALPMWTATIMRDEAGYLANAAAMAGHVFDGASSYHAGYSLAILPAYWIFHDPSAIYRGVQAMNLLLCASGIFLLYRWLRDLYPSQRRLDLALAVTVAAVYPAWSLLSTLAMSENATILLSVLGAFCCARAVRAGGLYWLAWGLAAGAMYAVHPIGIVAIAAGALVASLVAITRRDWHGFALYVVSAAAVAIAFQMLLRPWLMARLTLGSFPPNLHYPAAGAVLESLRTIDGWSTLALRIGGHFLYVVLATLWLAWFAFARSGGEAWRAWRSGTIGPEAASLALVAMTTLGTLVLSSLTFNALDSGLLDHFLYGRYGEATIVPVLAIGVLYSSWSFSWRSLLLGLAVGAGIAWVLTSARGLHDASDIVGRFNLTALWELYVVPQYSLLGWCLLGALAALLVFLIRAQLYRALVFLVIFGVTTAAFQQMYLAGSAASVSRRYQIADVVRATYPRTVSCIGIDTTGRSGFVDLDWPIAKFGTLLFDYGVRRVTLDEWWQDCDGPLISWARDLDTRVPGIHLLAAAEPDGTGGSGPYLWSRKGNGEGSAAAARVLAMGTGSPEVGMVLGQGWYAPEAEGTWSSARADLWLPALEDCGESCAAVVRFAPFRASPERPMMVDVYVDGTLVDHWRLTASGAQARSIPLFKSDAASSYRRIRLVMSGAASPAAIGASKDARILGIRVHSIELASQ